MISEQTLNEVIERIRAVAQPTRIILFGSHARGDAQDDSDLDLMIIEHNVKNPFDEISRIREAVGNIGTGIDLLIYLEADIEKRKNWCTSPVYWALREGRTLYAA